MSAPNQHSELVEQPVTGGKEEGLPSTAADLPNQAREWIDKTTNARWSSPREATRMAKSGYAPRKGTLAEWVIEGREIMANLEEQLEAQERELVAARIDLAKARDMCARPPGVCFPASSPESTEYPDTFNWSANRNQEHSPASRPDVSERPSNHSPVVARETLGGVGEVDAQGRSETSGQGESA